MQALSLKVKLSGVFFKKKEARQMSVFFIDIRLVIIFGAT